MFKKLMLFLSYAREDQKDATKLFEDLRNYGINIWADFDSLRPGSNWEIEIERAIKESHYFLALLSSNSVTKKGHIQKETKIALKILDEFTEEDIFIIPIRLNECVPSYEKLRALHRVDMFPSWDEGVDKILSLVAPDTQRSDHKQSDNEETADDEEIDINYILSQENKKNILIQGGNEIPYLESKSSAGPAECIIYANTYSQYLENAYFLEISLTSITIDYLKKIISFYYSTLKNNHHVSAFGINQETCSWFGYGPLNFIKSLEMQDLRYLPLRQNNEQIHHREAACFIDESIDSLFYIHLQPNRKDVENEIITLDYVNIGFLFNDIPCCSVYNKFFKKIGLIPNVIPEIKLPPTELIKFDQKIEKEGIIITNPDTMMGGWVSGIYCKNTKKLNVTDIYNDRIIVNLRQQHQQEDKCEYKILSVQATTLPASNFPAKILNYKGSWEIKNL